MDASVIVPAATKPRLRLLDGFDLRCGDEPVALRPPSERLLAFLALADKTVQRAAVAFQLWPDKPEPRAIANLRSVVWRIRRLPSDLIDRTPTHIRLHPDVWVDARDGLARSPSDAESLCEAAQHLVCQGDLLPDWYDDWLVVERERLRQQRLHALEHIVRLLIDRNQLPDAIDLGLRAVAMDPLRESAHRLVVKAHLREGNRAEAIRQFEACARLLTDELGVAPSARMTALLGPPG